MPKAIDWPHAPVHRLSEKGTYIVTTGTYQKKHHFKGSERLHVLHRELLSFANQFGWQLEAWVVFSNHYHFVAHSPEKEESAESLSRMLGLFHEKTGKWANELDGTPGRKVWFNYRDTLLTYQRSYLARLKYVHFNAVKHGVVEQPSAYPWCSATWFERTSTPAMVKTIYAFKTDNIRIYDDYEVWIPSQEGRRC